MRVSSIAVVGIVLLPLAHGLVPPRTSRIAQTTRLTSATIQSQISHLLRQPQLFAQSNEDNDGEAKEEQKAPMVPQVPQTPPTPPSPPTPPTPPSPPPPKAKAVEEVDDVTAEAERALKQAEDALNEASNPVVKTNEIDEARTKAIQAQRLAARVEIEKQLAARQIEGAVAGFGAFLFGIISGGVVDIFLTANNLDVDVDLIIPPTLLAISLGAAGVTLGQKDGDVGNFVRAFFGGPLKQLTNSVTTTVTNKIEETVDEIKATPGKIQQSVEKKIKDTTDEIKQIPVNIKENIEDTVEKTVDDIKQIPIDLNKAANDAVGKAKDEITDVTIRTVEEIKATPGRVVAETKETIVKTVEEVEDKVEKAVTGAVEDTKKIVDEVASIPGRTIDQVSSNFFVTILPI
jgi:ElaB/YqjD/DUF883 family membrane-anchored ribosome-binding protein